MKIKYVRNASLMLIVVIGAVMGVKSIMHKRALAAVSLNIDYVSTHGNMIELTLENNNESASIFFRETPDIFMGTLFVNEGSERVEALTKQAYDFRLVGIASDNITLLAPKEKHVWKVKIEDICDDKRNNIFSDKLGESLISARLGLELSLDSRKGMEGYKHFILTTSNLLIPHQTKNKTQRGSP